jgi:uncharacterized membrane protein (UPF0182 family)
MVIPIEESLIYVRPLYLRAASGRIPELTRVIVGYQNEIVMEETLDAALARLFGGRVPESSREPASTATAALPAAAPGTTAAAGGEGDLATLARSHYLRAIEAQRAGDWAKYGEEIRLLGDVLARMRP